MHHVVFYSRPKETLKSTLNQFIKEKSLSNAMLVMVVLLQKQA
jgi:hypothetical protein